MKYITTVNGTEYIVNLLDNGQIEVDDELYALDFQELRESGLLSLILENRSYEGVVAHREKHEWEVLLRGEMYAVRVQDERAYRLAKARGDLEDDTGTVPTKSPMPGVVVKVPVSVGDQIAKGDTLIILESMKMENELRATRDGIVLSIHADVGASVEKDAILVVIGDEQEEE